MRCIMSSKLCILFVCLIVTFVYSAKKKPKSVTTLINAKWEVTPLVLEMAEYLADEDSSLFWKFVDRISSLHPPLIEESSEKAYYDRAIRELGSFVSDIQISVLKFALSLHIYSPRVEMFGHIARERNIVCPTAVDVSGTIVCSIDQLEEAINEKITSVGHIEILRLDHKYPRGDSGPVVVLYGELGTPEFSEFHKFLKEKAEKGKIQYIIRHWVKERKLQKLRLSGYGVELQMKSTEYKVQDDTKVEGIGSDDASDEEEEVEGFNFHKLKQLYPDKVTELDKLKHELLESTSELAPLKVWQFQELSLQAAQRIMAAPKEEALHVMINIAQNFPTQAKSLVKTIVNPELKSEMRQNQDRFAGTLHLQPSDTALFINGMFFDFETQDIFTILEYIRQELRVMEGLYDIGITDKKVFKALLSLDLSNSGGDYSLDIRDSSIMWLNDIENDKAYRKWSSSLLDLLRPTFPGMLRSVRKNLYNLVVIGDPSQKSMWPLIKLLQSFLVHTAPLRLGMVFAVNDTKSGFEDSGVALLNSYNYLCEVKDSSSAINFITDVYASVSDSITPENVISLMKTKFPGIQADEVFGDDSDYNTGLKLSADFIARSGFRNLPQVLLNGVPLPEKSLSGEEFEDAVLNEIMAQTPSLQKAIYRGDLTDRDNVVDYIMSQPNVMPRLNERVLSPSKSKYIDLTKTSDIMPQLLKENIFYITNKIHAHKDIYLLTNWIVADLSTHLGRSLLLNSIQHMESSGQIRIGLIINDGPNKLEYHMINKLAISIMKSLPSDVAVNKLKLLLEDWEGVKKGVKTFKDYGLNKTKDVEDNSMEAVLIGTEVELDEEERIKKRVIVTQEGVNQQQMDVTESMNIINVHAQFLKEVLNFDLNQRAVLSNGRLLGPFETDENFTVEDFSLLERFSLTTQINKIFKVITANSEDGDSVSSDILMKSVSLLASRPESKSRFEIVPFGEEHSVLKLPANSNQPTFDLVAIVDPVSHGAHKLGTVLSILQHVIKCDIRIFLNCVEKNSDMPLKSFYRYVLEPSIHFTSDGKQSQGPIAKFSNMPGTPLLTQNMLVPDNWMVESIASPHDLDNIRLDQVDSNVHSQFELEYLILEGHCFDTTLGSPPRGLQVTLGAESSPTQFDTIVMANLGYFQLKANPGAWSLKLRHGRSAALFDITGYSHDGVDYPVNSSEIIILLSSFRAHTIKLKVTKKPDKMGVDLLGDDTDEQQSLWGSITSTFTGGKDEGTDPADETINIFSVASGHLYERFLRIMMLSVLKHTKSPVKFWFLKNYLSPTFKDFLPRMAKQYGFEFELVQYKWPRWLHQQTEKQRIIWGYKILFLDVLFPLDVKKIIFVDADQVVRADLKELVDLDLGGAPYGYTPFCDSRTEMDGFRFWRSGYWRNHLQGRKYHISALYVVDLKKFRRIAAGDRLRGQYQALSQDPNSLSNLDQDLPNNMIHQVAIKSLPQEWLWCETWCDDASKQKAKTIDLCNNPMTKEAKLTAAMRILPEWKDYDNEIKQLQLRLGATEDHEEESVSQGSTQTHQHSEL